MAVLSAAILYLTSQLASPQKLPRTSVNDGGFQYGTVISVTDGDTIKVDVDGNTLTVRLIGMDTPEINHPTQPPGCFGQEAKKALEDLILNKLVRLETDRSDKDRYGRSLRYVWLDNTLVNEYLVLNGYAFSYRYPPDTKYQSRLEEAQGIAESGSVGLWSRTTCAGRSQ